MPEILYGYARVLAEDNVDCIAKLRYVNDTITNEARANVVNKDYALFRGNKFMVEEIRSIKTNELYQTAHLYMSNIINNTTYQTGTIVESLYDNNLNAFGQGIYYVKTYDAALCFELKTIEDNEVNEIIHHVSLIVDNWTGEIRKYNMDGRLIYSLGMTNGIYNGICRYWHNNGNLWMRFNVTNNMMNGIYTEWYSTNNAKYKEVAFVNNQKNGLETKWFMNGNIARICHYHNDLLNGKYDEWESNGQHIISCMFVNGHINGLFKRWSDNGDLLLECVYSVGNVVNVINGEVDEEWYEYEYSDQL